MRGIIRNLLLLGFCATMTALVIFYMPLQRRSAKITLCKLEGKNLFVLKVPPFVMTKLRGEKGLFWLYPKGSEVYASQTCWNFPGQHTVGAFWRSSLGGKGIEWVLSGIRAFYPEAEVLAVAGLRSTSFLKEKEDFNIENIREGVWLTKVPSPDANVYIDLFKSKAGDLFLPVDVTLPLGPNTLPLRQWLPQTKASTNWVHVTNDEMKFEGHLLGGTPVTSVCGLRREVFHCSPLLEAKSKIRLSLSSVAEEENFQKTCDQWLASAQGRDGNFRLCLLDRLARNLKACSARDLENNLLLTDAVAQIPASWVPTRLRLDFSHCINENPASKIAKLWAGTLRTESEFEVPFEN